MARHVRHVSRSGSFYSDPQIFPIVPQLHIIYISEVTQLHITYISEVTEAILRLAGAESRYIVVLLSCSGLRLQTASTCEAVRGDKSQ